MPIKRYDGTNWVVVAGDGAPGAQGSSSTTANVALTGTEEVTNIVAAAAPAAINIDAITSTTWYYTSSATSNFTINFRGSGGATLSSILPVNNAISFVLLVTQGSTAYYGTAFTIDGTSVTPKWAGGSAPSAGNASGIDAYSFTIVKTASTPTYTVLAGLGKFA